ncbi:hypothetical protein P691DRAFT_780589 [Macrolepiota fuliginosa MF-IS2]|uniref:Uncharacterized protein n=1 Tax=Macrolepiota fuliginosa MF-IS2 TaxID=1400762 RepID=A0A9P5WY00_9AGAR|nr:hypothetical protein P691DRAFT_780589 [Macrolepiota fuliginosa MF-IS2]
MSDPYSSPYTTLSPLAQLSTMPSHGRLQFKINVPLRVYIHANADGIDGAVTEQLSKALEKAWPSIQRKYHNAEENIELGLITPYPHWTLKWIYKCCKIVGTLHIPGQDGCTVDWWWNVGRKWKKRDVSAEFRPWGLIKCMVVAKRDNRKQKVQISGRFPTKKAHININVHLENPWIIEDPRTAKPIFSFNPDFQGGSCETWWDWEF